MGQHSITRRYSMPLGLDYKSSDLSRPSAYAARLLNTVYREGLEKRKGCQIVGASAAGSGEATYKRADPVTGQIEEIKLSFGESAYRLQQATITVTYTGSSAAALFSLFFDTDTEQFRCKIVDGDTTVLDLALGLGYEEATPVTIDALRSAIDALADFSATLSGIPSVPAAYVAIVREYDLTDAPYEASATYEEEVNTTVAFPFSNHWAKRNDIDFENVSTVQLKNILYATTGWDDVQKYDGQTLYRAGLPNPASLASAAGAAGSISGSSYFHRIRYLQKDAVGNVFEGNSITVSTGLTVAAKKIDLTAANVLAGTGFNTNCGHVGSNQVGVTTISLAAVPQHTLKEGDTAYFLDRLSGLYVEREVTAIGISSITIAGAAVNVNLNDVISNNLRIVVERTKTGGSLASEFYVVAEIPNDSFTATQVYVDDVTDANLGALVSDPVTDRGTPPRCKYISKFKKQLVLAGDPTNGNRISWSDVDGAEYFPGDGSNEDEAETPNGSIITGIGGNNEVFVVFKNPGIVVVAGDIANGRPDLRTISTDFGCAAHATICELKGALAFVDPDRGPYQMVGGNLPEPLGRWTDPDQPSNTASRIEPVFLQDGLSADERLNFKKAVAINHAAEKLYILFLPAETTAGGERNANDNSRIFAYDYSRDAWHEWDNLNMMGGATLVGEELYWRERRYSTALIGSQTLLYRRLHLADGWDYQDHHRAIEWDIAPQWDDLGEPSVLKRLMRVSITSLDGTPFNDMSVLSIDVEADYLVDVPIANFDLAFNTGGYGEAEYGNARYGDPADPSLPWKIGRGRFGAWRIRFRNNQPQKNAVVNAWESEFATPYRLTIKD